MEPISLIGFEGNAVDGRVVLSWSTGSEIDNHSFVIERSNSAQGSFVEIAQISAQGGVGTTEYSYLDATVQIGQTYFYRLVDVSIYGYPTVHADNVVEVTLAGEFRMAQNYPNPFNPTTAINYQLSADSHVSLEVFDSSGRSVATLVNGWTEAGDHQITFDGSAISSGIYFAKLTAGEHSQTQKMVLMK